MNQLLPPLAELRIALPFVLIALAGGYLLGSIPGGHIMAKLRGLGDLSKVGSGNVGATNVLRTGDKVAALMTLLIDAGKGVAAVLLFALFGPYEAMAAALGAFFGHLWSPWIGFRGGKGVAIFLGLLYALFWPIGLIATATWAAVAYVTRFSSVASLTAAATAPIWFVVFSEWRELILAVTLGALIWAAHIGNIRRLLAGAEPRIGASKRL